MKIFAAATSFFLLAGGPSAFGEGVRFQIDWQAQVDCDAWRNIAVTAHGTAVLLPDRSASMDLTIQALVLSSVVHFDGRLGSRTAAPGGTAELHVTGLHKLRAVWGLENNDFVLDLAANKNGCVLSVKTPLHPGQKVYSLYLDGYYYCQEIRDAKASCEVS